MIDSCWICSDDPPDKRCGGYGCWSSPMERLTREQLKGLARPRVCVTCQSRLALTGKPNLSNYCEKCDPQSPPRHVKAFGKGFGHDKDGAASLLEEQMEANGTALEGSVTRAGGGLSRGWSGARLSDYDRPEE